MHTSKMFSDHNGEKYPTKWALHPSAYENMSADQIDWAALAQQWIQMKDTCPPEMVPPAPPPPPITSLVNTTPIVQPMKSTSKEDFITAPPAPSWTNPAWGFQQQNWPAAPPNNWGWNSTITPPPPPPVLTTPVQKESVALLPTPTFNTFTPLNEPTYPNSTSKTYWAGADPPNTSGSKDHKSGYKSRRTEYPPEEEEDDTTLTLDAAKRKQLPAWIREGLEKMEREKQKQLEKQEEAKQHQLLLQQKKLEEEAALKEIQADGMPSHQTKSKFDSDSDDDGKLNSMPKENSASKKIMELPKSALKSEKKPHKILTPFRTKEEKLQDIMMTVRRTLTEILLEVTNDEIYSISRDTVLRARTAGIIGKIFKIKLHCQQ